MDFLSGILYCEERDFNTSFSFFLEGFETFHQMREEEGVEEKAVEVENIYTCVCDIINGIHIHNIPNIIILSYIYLFSLWCG